VDHPRGKSKHFILLFLTPVAAGAGQESDEFKTGFRGLGRGLKKEYRRRGDLAVIQFLDRIHRIDMILRIILKDSGR
jgi:hypothetical protein